MMSSGAIGLGRVSFQQSSSLLLGTLQFDQSNLLSVQQQISTGNRLNLPSDDPGATLGIQSLNRQLANNTQFTSNLNFAKSFLGQADSSLGTLNTLLTQASSIASSQIGVGSTADERAAQAQVVNSLLSQALDLGNAQYNGQYVFGGQNTSTSPFVSAGGGYQYVGSSQQQGILTPTGSQIQYTVDGNQVFGGTSSQVTGYQNLSPALTASTRLADVAGARGQGVTTGSVNLTVGATTVSVDLSHAATAGDVVNLLNAALTGAGSDATLSLSGGSLVVNGDSTQNIAIADLANSTTAADLGIAGATASTTTTTGTPLSPKVTATTPISSLNNGAGIDPSGFIITNGANSATITLSGITTVSDLVNAINNSGTGVQASINTAGSGINLFNPISGSSLTIGENGGNTAQQLGIRSFNPTTSLAGLNNGSGITPIANTIGSPSGQITITKTDGTAFNVNVSGIKTSSQLIAAINAATGNGGTVTAAINTNDNGITLTDSAGGPGNVSVAAGPNYVSNGSDFGLFQTGSGATLTGTSAVYSTDDFRVTRKDGTTFTVNLTGTSTIQDVLNAINNADGNTTPANHVTAGLNATGNGISLSDASTGSGNLTVSSLNSSSAASQLGILKTAAAATSGTINGDDTNPLQPQGLFTSLSMLRDALLNNDDAGIQRAETLLQQDSQRVIKAQGIVGAREQDIASRLTETSDQQTNLKSSLSLLHDTDVTSAITKYQSLETAYEAALKVASTTNNLSLLDFLS